MRNNALPLLALAAAYIATAKLGFLVAIPPGNVTAVWLPSGIALAAALLMPHGAAKGVWAGSFAANLWFFHGLADSSAAAGIAVSAAIATGSTLQALLGARLIRKWLTPPYPHSCAADVFRFLGIEAFSCVLAATVGTTSLILAGLLPAGLSPVAWFTWWLGDLMGTLIVAPVILSLAAHPWPETLASSRSHWAEAAAISVVLVGGSLTVFTWVSPIGIRRYTFALLTIPLLFWPAMRLGPSAVTVGSLAVTAVALASTASGLGPFAESAPSSALVTVQVFLAIVSLTGLALAAAVTQERLARAALLRSHAELEERVRDKTSDLLRSNEDLSRFAAAASHDLKSPLNKIVSFGDMLARRLGSGLDAESRDCLERMQKSAWRLGQLVDNLLRLAKVTEKKEPLQAVALEPLIQEVLSTLEDASQAPPAKLALGRLPVVNADPAQMRQLFENLIGNALKFHAPGETPEISINGTALDNGTVEIVVEDRGIGFDKNFTDRLFQPFQRLHSRKLFEGTGLGLALCARIAARHGGSIRGETGADRGARFTVTLPGLDARNTGVPR